MTLRVFLHNVQVLMSITDKVKSRTGCFPCLLAFLVAAMLSPGSQVYSAASAREPSPAKPDISFAVSGSLWGYNNAYIMEFGPDIIFEIPLEKSLVRFDITLPVFVGLVYESSGETTTFKGLRGYFRGFASSNYGTTVWPRIVSPGIYMATWLKSASWQGGDMRLAITPETPDIDFAGGNALWYNPFFDARTGILNRYVEFSLGEENNYAGVNASSLTDPRLLFAYYKVFPLKKMPVDFFKGWSVTPALWTDLGNLSKPDFGAAVETSTGGFGNSFFRLSLSAQGHVFSTRNILDESLSYRVDAGLTGQFRPFGIYVGYLGKSPRHPFGPYLSPLYVGRGPGDYQENTKNRGILVRLKPGLEGDERRGGGFAVDTEIYPDNPMTFSIKGQLRATWQESSLGVAYIHEDISGLADFLANRADRNSFIEFHLQYYLLPETFRIEWRHVVSFYDSSTLKTIVSLSAFF